MFKFKKSVEEACGYKRDQYVLQSPDVDAKIVDENDGDFACHIDTDTASVFMRINLSSKKNSLDFAKKHTVELVGRLAPKAKPGKRSL